ncbi:hypothetical protein E1B28_003714 [Marasmius oreades]|uniref:Uncharacterized protein n=1 Tax=Marasmius oreades TaxID=181124 RepID=A0A9P8AAK6_9AGAR|nr:uncharacterized protein E1B28_003714 [Marasmius oreades]KAG7096266.1 hypothetical protein E1B28_003714 [Marasmius oreades]
MASTSKQVRQSTSPPPSLLLSTKAQTTLETQSDMSNPKFLVDIDGNAITTDQWYKIMLSDGTELGVGAIPDHPGMPSGPVPSGQGMVVRYRLKENNDTALYRWVEGETGFIRGLRTDLDGTQTRKNLSLSYALNPTVLAWYDPSVSGASYGIKAYQLPGNRIALYGLDHQGKALGLRVYRESTGVLSIRSMGGDWALSLDVAFVRMDKTFAVNGNPYF